MEIKIFENKRQMGAAAAAKAADLFKDAIDRRGQVVFVAATGSSQFEFLEALARTPGIDWSRTTFFHLDEYIGLPASHPASFRRYLQDRLIEHVHPGEVHLIHGDASDPHEECGRLNRLIAGYEIDVAFVGIGENGHLAFNDPPADFQTEEPYIVVDLDEACRRQQLGEGWFSSFDEVPRRAITMSIQQIMKARAIICTVPDRRKAQAVKDCFTGEVGPFYPASILRQHPIAHIFLDSHSASGLTAARLAGTANFEIQWKQSP